MIDSILADVPTLFYSLEMENAANLPQTICSLVQEKAGGEPINLLEIGPILVTDMGFSQEQIVNALFSLVSAKAIELMPHNRVRLLKQETPTNAYKRA